MRILLDARFWRKETGGIGRYSRELLRELLRLKTDDQFHVLLTPADEPQFAVRDARVHPHVVPIGHYSLAEQLRLPGLIRALRPDVVHFLNFNQPLLPIGAPRVTTIHDLTVKYFPVGRQQSDPVRRLAFNWVLRHAAASDAVIAVSRSTKIDIVRELGPDPARVHVIYESADAVFAPRPATELASFRQRVGLDRPYLLFVNQWRPHKGLPELIQAFESLKADGLPHKLVITGKPNAHFPELVRAIEASLYRAEIVLPGFVSDADLPCYMAAAEVLAFPSYYEGFGLPVLEAMRSGTPVVYAQSSSLPEVVGEAGLGVPPKDVPALAAALKRVLTDSALAKQLSRAGITRAKEFSWSTMAKQTYALYERVLRGQRTEVI
ncbi:glycosyltransferase family 4 protein [Candidatus Berkelbacteria bacterium]|nr:glycosyltransferase family 4 protein [Candidatus Berkelbacteria bacterium]